MLAPDQRDAVAEPHLVEIDQCSTMPLLLIGHLVEDAGPVENALVGGVGLVERRVEADGLARAALGG